MAWLAVGVTAAVAWSAWSLFGQAALPLRALGLYDVVYPAWESVLCFGMCIGLLVLFREAIDVQGPLGKFLSANQYSAYFWHPLLIVSLQSVIHGLSLCPLVKFGLVAAVGVPVVFVWSWAFRNLKPVGAVL